MSLSADVATDELITVINGTCRASTAPPGAIFARGVVRRALIDKLAAGTRDLGIASLGWTQEGQAQSPGLQDRLGRRQLGSVS